MEAELSVDAADAGARHVRGIRAGVCTCDWPRLQGARAITAPALVVDARALSRSGIGRYTREVVSRLIRRGAFADVTLCGDVAELAEFLRAESLDAHIVGRSSRRYTLSGPRYPSSTPRTPSPVSFFPHWDAPPFSLPVPSVITVHDLTHLRVRGTAPWWKRAGMRWWLERVVSRAARIVCVSEHTQRDLVEFAPGCASRTRVIHNGATTLAPGAATAQRSAQLPAGVRAPYLLAVGNRKPHKNFECAVRVLAELAMNDGDLTLVVVGENGPHWRRVMALAESLGVARRVVALDPVSDGVLRALYAGAEALLVPSRYEGFGLPLLEAMACGTPVVASNAASIPEVAGDAALMFAPDDHSGMAGAVRRLRSDTALRADVVARGRARAATFSWDRCAEETERVLLDAATER